MFEKIKASHLYISNWQLLLFSYSVPILLFIPFLILAGREEGGNVFILLISLASLVCATAFFLGSSQREFMARSFTFMLPHFRQGMVRQHFIGAGLTSFLCLILILAIPGFHDLGRTPLSLAWAGAAFMFSLYGLTVLIVFHFPFATWLPLNSFWIIFAMTQLWGDTPPANLGRILDLPLVWTGLAVAVGWWMQSRLSRPGLHRRCAEEPYISAVDVKSQAKIEKFKQARRRHKQDAVAVTRPGQALIQSCREWSARQWALGRRSRGLVGEAVTTLLLTAIPRRLPWVLLHGLLLPAMVTFLGYLEGYLMVHKDGDMAGWIPGMVYMYAYWSAQAFHHLKNRPLGLLRSRRDQHRAGWLGMLVLLGWCLGASLAIRGMFELGATFLPTVATSDGDPIPFLAPSNHLVLLPLFYLPVQVAIFIRWPMKGSAMVLQQAGTMTFFLFNGLLLWGNTQVVSLAVGLAVLAWLTLAWVWHWRVQRSDLA